MILQGRRGSPGYWIEFNKVTWTGIFNEQLLPGESIPFSVSPFFFFSTIIIFPFNNVSRPTLWQRNMPFRCKSSFMNFQFCDSSISDIIRFACAFGKFRWFRMNESLERNFFFTWNFIFGILLLLFCLFIIARV